MLLKELIVRLGVQSDQAKLEKFESGMKAVKIGMAAVGAAAGAIAYQLFGLTREVADLTKQLDLTAQRVGIDVEALQELQYAAIQDGVAVGTLQMGLKTLARVMSEASLGMGEYIDTMDRLGVPYKEADGSLRSLDSMIGDISEKFKAMPNGAEKAALAVELFGRGGLDMIPMLNKGTAGLEAMRKELRSIGGVMSRETITMGAELSDALTTVSTAWSGLKFSIFEAIGPKFLKLLKESIIPAIVRFKEWANTTGALNAALKALGYTLAGIGIAIGLWSLGSALKGLASLVTMITAAGNASLVATVKMLGGPILIGAAFAALILIIDDLNHYMEGTDSLIGRIVEKNDGIKLMVDIFTDLVRHLTLVGMAFGWLGEKILGTKESATEAEEAFFRGLRSGSGRLLWIDVSGRYSRSELDRMAKERETEADIDATGLDDVKARVRARINAMATAGPGGASGRGGGSKSVTVNMPIEFNNMPDGVTSEQAKEIIRETVDRRMDDVFTTLDAQVTPAL